MYRNSFLSPTGRFVRAERPAHCNRCEEHTQPGNRVRLFPPHNLLAFQLQMQARLPNRFYLRRVAGQDHHLAHRKQCLL